MHLNVGDKARLTGDVISSFFDKGEIYISGTKGSIAVILSPEEFLPHDPYKQIYRRAEATRLMMKEKWYPIRYEKKASLTLIRPSGFDIIDQCNEGSVDLVSGCNLEILDEDV